MDIRALFLTCFIAFIMGCTSMESIQIEHSKAIDSLVAGDRIHIHEHSNQITVMDFNRIESGKVYGQQIEPPFSELLVDVANIRLIKRENINKFTTNLAIGAASVVVVPWAIITGAAGVK